VFCIFRSLVINLFYRLPKSGYGATGSEPIGFFGCVSKTKTHCLRLNHGPSPEFLELKSFFYILFLAVLCHSLRAIFQLCCLAASDWELNIFCL